MRKSNVILRKNSDYEGSLPTLISKFLGREKRSQDGMNL